MTDAEIQEIFEAAQMVLKMGGLFKLGDFFLSLDWEAQAGLLIYFNEFHDFPEVEKVALGLARLRLIRQPHNPANDTEWMEAHPIWVRTYLARFSFGVALRQDIIHQPGPEACFPSMLSDKYFFDAEMFRVARRIEGRPL